MPEVQIWSGGLQPEAEIRHRRTMTYNGSRLRLTATNGANDSKDCTCKMVLLGCHGVGKTALTTRYITKRFIGEYCPTLESINRYHTVIDDDEVKLEILDTAGQGPYPWKDAYALWGDCFLFVYSITDRGSFQELVQLKQQVDNVRKSTSTVAFLVANKNDLLHDRQVTEAEGEELADGLGCRFYEVSASDGCQVEAVALLFADLYREHRKAKLLLQGRHRKSSSSGKFRQAIQKVIGSGGRKSSSGSSS